MRILFSNLGYARGIDGSLAHHVFRFGRNFYTGRIAQQNTLRRFKTLVHEYQPDVCCLVEIDSGSPHSAGLNQMDALLDRDYRFRDIAGKYGEDSLLGRLPLHQGKSNGFLARHDFPFQRLYFTHGTKRLIYRLTLPGLVTLFFAHFSLKAPVRALQFLEMRQLIAQTKGDSMILADFNIFEGFGELRPLTENEGLKLLNRADEPTFRFHKRRLPLDLCLCTPELAARSNLKILPQDFSDHAALLVEITDAR